MNAGSARPSSGSVGGSAQWSAVCACSVQRLPSHRTSYGEGWCFQYRPVSPCHRMLLCSPCRTASLGCWLTHHAMRRTHSGRDGLSVTAKFRPERWTLTISKRGGPSGARPLHRTGQVWCGSVWAAPERLLWLSSARLLSRVPPIVLLPRPGADAASSYRLGSHGQGKGFILGLCGLRCQSSRLLNRLRLPSPSRRNRCAPACWWRRRESNPRPRLATSAIISNPLQYARSPFVLNLQNYSERKRRVAPERQPLLPEAI